MNTSDISGSLTTVFSELINGAPRGGAYVLNGGDPGLLKSLDKLSAAAASATTNGGASVAAHAEHLRYGLSLMNRWSKGENPWNDADWTASWKKTRVSDAGWKELRSQLAEESHNLLKALGKPRTVDEAELNGMIGTIVHFAYHAGAIRQIDRGARGPSATE
ncbi:MAG TPA: hypothetical protein VFT29_20115 [Gemmatimonadaceae bacterium]|nr:hypothetical protein [Gemmatimonadaceae bacterium]